MKCNAEHFNGLSTIPRQVSLELMHEYLLVKDMDIEFRYSYSQIVRPDKIPGAFRCSLSNNADPAEPVHSVQFTDPEFFKALDTFILKASPFHARIGASFWGLGLFRLLILTILILAGFIGLFYYLLLRAYLLAPVSYDTHLGERFHATWSNFIEPCSSPQLDTFFTKALATLSLPDDRFTHKVIILNDTTQNAIALPGGTIYVFKGLIEQSSSPDELLGVLSHEIAHSEKRHTVRQIIQSTGVTYIITLSIGMAIDGADLLDGLEKTLEMSSVLFMLRYSRGFEREADSLAINRLHHADLRVGPLDTLLNRLTPKPRLRDRFFSILSTHPLTQERSVRFVDARSKETFPQDTVFVTERLQWNTIKRSCPAPKDSTPLWKKLLR
jgi:beta-barrel assembly-enhancing protease